MIRRSRSHKNRWSICLNPILIIRDALFLEAQKLAVARDAARHVVVVASVNPKTDDQLDEIFVRLARVTSNIKEIAESVDQARAALDSATDTLRQRSLSSDLLRLHQELLIDVVSMSLLQTELFPAGGRDAIAAANKAEQAADQALGQLPPATPARFEIERLRVQAILRTGQYDRAASQLDTLMRLMGKPFPPEIHALQLRLDVARDRMRDAGQTITAFYGGNESFAPKSVEMDMARLEFLLVSQDPSVGKWIDQIERRNGVFARRRAEAISLSRLRSPGTAQVVDASIIAAQGRDWLRRGNPKRAGDLLSAAARAEQSADRAIARATEAAAALIAAKQKPAAAKILAEVSRAKPGGKKASQAHLQAAHLYALEKQPDAAAVVESVLRATIEQWPESNEADQARTWLLHLLQSQDRIIEAAKAATDLPPAKVSQQRLDVAVELWMQAVRASDASEVNELGRDYLEAFELLVEKSALSRDAFRSTAAFVLDQEFLDRVDDSETTADDYADKLLAFRRTPGNAPLPAPPAKLRDETIWRLMRDGRQNRLTRKRNALTIQNWEAEPVACLDQVERLIWLEDVDQAVAMVRSLSQESTSPGKTLTEAARLLGSSDNGTAMSEAVALWDQLAAGIPQGTPAWHDAKIQAIQLLAATGRWEEAAKRAKFVLLTTAPKDTATRSRYETLAKESAWQP